MVEFHVLGTAELCEGGEEIESLSMSPRRLGVLAYLALARPRGFQRRDELLALFWPERGQKAARNALRNLLYHLRQALGDGVIVNRGTEEVYVKPDRLWTDAVAFDVAMDQGDTERALMLYRGHLLEGVHVPGAAPAFEHWLDRERERLRIRAREGAWALAEEAEQSGEVRAAAEWWQRLAYEDPYDSHVTCRLVQALVGVGNRAAALRAADTHTRLLINEVGGEPSAEVQALVARLKAPGPSLPAALANGTRPRPPRSVAVLPFDTLTDSEEARDFATGLHADLVNELARLSALTVISRSSVLRYRDASKPLHQIARELGARTVVEGVVQKVGSRVRLRVQLVDAEHDTHLWAERYDGDLSPGNMFALQSELTREIGRALRAELTDTELDRLERSPTADLEAYRLYIKGCTRMESRTEADLRAAADLFRSAIARDERYAQAWAGLAVAVGLLVSYFHAAGQPSLDEAMAAARRAVELDPGLSEGHAALGLIHMDRKEGPQSVRALQHAVDLSPGNAHAHGVLGYAYLAVDRNEEGWYHLQKYAQLNPMSPEAHLGLGYGHMFVGYPAEEALRHARRAQELGPGYEVAYLVEGHILTASGRPKEGARAVRRGLDRSSPGSRARHLATLVYAYEQSGQRSQARHTLAELEATDNGFFLGMAYAALGAKDEAFAVLRDVDWTGHHSAHLRYDSALELLRSDARYGDLVRRVNSIWGLLPDGRFPESPRWGKGGTTAPSS